MGNLNPTRLYLQAGDSEGNLHPARVYMYLPTVEPASCWDAFPGRIQVALLVYCYVLCGRMQVPLLNHA